MERIYSPELNETIYYEKHKSGLDIYALPKEGYRQSYAVFATKYGSTDVKFRDYVTGEIVEIPDGVAHFLEHKMFEQPGGGNAFDEFSLTGASANAFTSFTTTAYLFSCTTDFYKNLETLIGFVQAPYFTDENIEKEQGIIGQEIRMYQDNPSWRAYFNTIEAMYQKNPVRIDIAGSIESIGTITKDLLYKCYRNFYHPSNMVLVCVGDVDFSEVFNTADKAINPEFKALPEIERFTEIEPEAIFKKTAVQNLSVAMPMFYLGFKENGAKKEDLLKNEIMNEILCECIFGASSKFYRRLYESGLISGNLSFETTNELNYSHILVGGESKSPEKAAEEIRSELKRVISEGVERDRFERIKKVFYGDFVRMFNSTEGIAQSIMEYAFKGFGLFDYIKAYNEVTYENAMERIKKIFCEELSVLSVIRSED